MINNYYMVEKDSRDLTSAKNLQFYPSYLILQFNHFKSFVLGQVLPFLTLPSCPIPTSGATHLLGGAQESACMLKFKTHSALRTECDF